MAERTNLKQIRDTGKRKKAGTDIGVMGALADPQFREDVLRGLGETSARGVAGVLGAPVDLATMALRPFGYSVPAEQVVGGSDYIGRQMERAGLISGERRPIAEMLGGIMTPDPMDVAKLGAMAVPVVARRMAPRDEALRIAQANAAKPTSEGGLGLRPDNTPMERAQAMGFETPTYRGTTADEAQSRSGIYSTGNIDYANKFAKHEGANVMPLMISRRKDYLPANQSEIEQIGYFPEMKQEMLNRGIDTVSWVSPNRIDRGASGWGDDASQFYSLNPANVRSRFAAFDPAKRYESDLLGAANPVLLGTIAAGTGAGLYGYNQRQKEKEKRPAK